MNTARPGRNQFKVCQLERGERERRGGRERAREIEGGWERDRRGRRERGKRKEKIDTNTQTHTHTQTRNDTKAIRPILLCMIFSRANLPENPLSGIRWEMCPVYQPRERERERESGEIVNSLYNHPMKLYSAMA